MTAERIAKGLREAATPDHCIEVVRAIPSRRDELRAMIAERAAPPSAAFPVPPRRARALETGQSALEELDHEVEGLHRELAFLEELERQAYEKAGVLKAAAIRAEAPRARKALPGAAARVRRAITELDAAIEALRGPVEMVASLAALPGEKFPLDDAEVAELLELRENLWANPRTVPSITPPIADSDEAHDFPMSAALTFERRGGPGNVRVVRRGPPVRIDITQIGEPTYRF